MQNLSNNLRRLKSRADKLDADLSKLSVVVKNDIVKKDVYNGQIESMEDRIPLILLMLKRLKTKYLVSLT